MQIALSRKRLSYWMMAILVTTCFSSCINDLGEVSEAAQMTGTPIERGRDIEIIYSEEGMVRIRLTADSLTRYLTEEPYVEFNEGLEVFFFDNRLQVTSTLSANYGIRYEKDGKTIVRNDVLVVNEKKEELSTEELVWDTENKIIYSDKFVKIKTEDEILFGTGFESDEEFKRYKILNPEGTIKVKVEDDEPVDEDI